MPRESSDTARERSAVERELRRTMMPEIRTMVEAELRPRLFKWAALGALASFVLFVIGGQFWPGYTLDDNVELEVTKAVDAALKPVATDFLAARCLEQANADPDMAAKIEGINAAASYEKNGKFRQTGWADIPGYLLSATNKSLVVNDCQKLLFPPAEATNTTPG